MRKIILLLVAVLFIVFEMYNWHFAEKSVPAVYYAGLILLLPLWIVAVLRFKGHVFTVCVLIFCFLITWATSNTYARYEENKEMAFIFTAGVGIVTVVLMAAIFLRSAMHDKKT